MSILISCSLKGNKKDFYSYSKDGDLYRIPLVNPYEVYNNGFIDEPWFFDLPYGNSGLSTDQVAINKIGKSENDSLFILYSNRMAVPGGMTEVWFSVDFKNKKERYFTDSLSYKFYLDSAALDIVLIECKELFNDFERTGKWRW